MLKPSERQKNIFLSKLWNPESGSASEAERLAQSYSHSNYPGSIFALGTFHDKADTGINHD
jgi:hypothetical protein